MKLIPHYSQHPRYCDPGLHLLYVGDSHRAAVFRDAIHECVKPGMVVADIGTGSGIMARMAVEAGADKVYAIEQNGQILRYAKRISESGSEDPRIEYVEGDSREVVLNEKVDVIVAELIGGIGDDEAMSAILEDARRRFLKPGGMMIPNKVDAFLCPVNAPEVHAQIPAVYEDDVIVPPDRARSPFNAYYEVLGLPAERLLAGCQLLDSIDLTAHTEMSYRRRFTFECRSDGMFSGIAAWFEARMSDSVVLDTSPSASPTAWGQSYFAVREQTPVQRGDQVALEFSAIVPPGSDRPFYVWQGNVTSGGKVLLDFSETNELPPIAPRVAVRGA